MESQTSIEKKQPWLVPWWLYLLIAICSYVSLTYLLPALTPSDTSMAKLFLLAPKAAPIVTIVFLLLTANALYRDDPPPESQNDPENNKEEKEA